MLTYNGESCEYNLEVLVIEQGNEEFKQAFYLVEHLNGVTLNLAID